jgi:hypothetical protein
MPSSIMFVVAARPPSSTPRGPAIDVLLNLVVVASIFQATPSRGGTMVNATTTSKANLRERIFPGPYHAKDLGNIIVR